ncbi:hypothetical protein DMJ13_27390 [halophilic archaeon]|nr:hypothetical protein DMJ13_27390 [halophilic archaeon]
MSRDVVEVDDRMTYVLPEEGDRIRVWYRSTYSDSSVPRAVVGTVTEVRSPKTGTSIEFDGDDVEADPGDRYWLRQHAHYSHELHKAAPNETSMWGQSYREVSRTVVAVSTLPADAFGRTPPSPFVSSTTASG